MTTDADRPARHAVYGELMWPEWNQESESYGIGGKDAAYALLDAYRAEILAETETEQPAPVSVDTLARMLSSADVEINHGDYPTWDDLAESGEAQYRQAARYLLARLRITATPAATEETAR